MKRLALAALAALALPPAPAHAANRVQGYVYVTGTTSCASTGPLGSCTHTYSTPVSPPLHGIPCEESLNFGGYTQTCSTAFNGTSTQVGIPATPATGKTCMGTGEATIDVTSSHAGGPYAVPVEFTIDRGWIAFEGDADFGTTHVHLSGSLIGTGICTGSSGTGATLAFAFSINY